VAFIVSQNAQVASDCYSCYANFVDCVYEDDCGYRGETSVRNVASWIKSVCLPRPVCPPCVPVTCPPCEEPESCPEATTVPMDICSCPPCEVQPVTLTTVTTPGPCEPCQVEEAPTSCPPCQGADLDLPSRFEPRALVCPPPTALTCRSFMEGCGNLLKSTTVSRNDCLSGYRKCNETLEDERKKVLRMTPLQQQLTSCLTGYGNCNASLANQSFKELLVNYTWSNETDHLRADLQDCQKLRIEETGRANTCERVLLDVRKNYSLDVTRLEGKIFIHETNNRLANAKIFVLLFS
jgi:hypothetical protein